jgi:DNA-binding transcriptional LysR family regulator
MLNDELFLRTPEGMEPTPYALELAPSIREVLSGLQSIVRPTQFRPEQDRRAFRLLMMDSAAATILPPVYAYLHSSAPGITLRLRPNSASSGADMLDSREIDFHVGVIAERPARHRYQALYREQFVCAMRREHPLARQTLTLETYLQAPHAVFVPTSDGVSIIDRVLDTKGLARNTVLTVNHMLVAPILVKNSDLLVTISSRTAELFRTLHGLHVVPLPFSVEPYEVGMAWHERSTKDAAHTWMREKFADLCSRI